MSDEKALLAAIWEHPHEDTPRLMYADWLDEQGGDSNAARAELIRVQCELEHLAGDDPRYDGLEKRVEEIVEEWGKRWWKAMPTGCKKGSFVRGLPVPYLGALSLGGLVKLDETRLRAAPLWSYHGGVHGHDLDVLLPWPYLHRLEQFALRPPLPADWATQLADCDNLRNVTELALIDCMVLADDMKTLLDGWARRPLTSLRMRLDAKALRVLAEHPTAAKLRYLTIEECRLPPSAIKTIAKSQYLTNLVGLWLRDMALGDAGMKELLKWPGLAKVRRLGLGRNGLTNASAQALAKCPASANLRWLWLADNRIGAAGAKALAASPYLVHLKEIYLYDTPAETSSTALPVLSKRFGKGLLV